MEVLGCLCGGRGCADYMVQIRYWSVSRVLTVLFNAGFNTPFEYLTPLEEECGCQFRDWSKRMRRVLVTGYADDIGLLMGTRCGNDAFKNNQFTLSPSLTVR